MPTSSQNDHLATITPNEYGGDPQVLTLAWNLLGNSIILATPLLIIAAAVLTGQVIARITSVSGLSTFLPSLVCAIGIQVAWAGAFPEWPGNQLLAFRMRRLARRRGSRDSYRMVEWVPRENWQAVKLETASDLMLIHVSETGVLMEGDRQNYDFPSASIIDASVHSVRPTGCFHAMHYVILTVRTASGPMEFPIAFRDPRLGRLRSSARRREAFELQSRIAAIATGSDFSFSLQDSVAEQDTDRGTEQLPPFASQLANPYAAPRSV